jgi:hypothetical protein
MNVVIIEPDRSWTLRGHSWAAEYLDVDLLNEPEAVVANLRQYEERDWWYDEIFAEGGVVVDVGTRELVCFGGYELVRTIPMHRRYLEVLGAVWAGWQVRWAWRRQAGILGAVGLADHPAGRERLPLEWADKGNVADSWPDLYDHVLSVRDPAGNLRLHLARRRAVRDVLVAGPAIAGTTGAGRATLALPDPGTWGDGAHIDLGTRSLTYWTRDGLVPPPDLDSTWPGWQLRFDQDRYENQVAECGGALVMPEPPLGETVAAMIDAIGRLRMPPPRREFIECALRL